MIKRIKYVSRFSQPLTSGEIESLVTRSAEKNRSLDITGVLMTTGGLFFQILEGPAEHVNSLYTTIVSDDRHKDVLLLNVEEDVRTRLFPDWSMKKMDLDMEKDARLEPLKILVTAVVKQRRHLEDLVGVLERTVWAELSED